MTHILHIDSSARHEASVSRELAKDFVARHPNAQVTKRDLADGIPHIGADFTRATFTPPNAQSKEDQAALALSDQIVAEVQAADLIVIAAPIYNFSIPSSLKAWIDHLARAGVTFRYGEDGQPEGLLQGKRVVIVTASGGTPVGAPFDFATPYLKFALGFVGLTDIDIVGAAGGDGIGAAKAELQDLAA